jgi:hypothetical protein
VKGYLPGLISAIKIGFYSFVKNRVLQCAIKIVYNPCEHSKTKHIDIQYHLLKDHAIKRDIVILHAGTNEQLADIFIMPLDERRFHELRSELNIIDSRNVA